MPGIPLHVTQRGVNRCAIFVDDVDRRHLYLLLRDAATQYGVALHAYVFMGNHIHLLLTSPDGDALPHTMRKVGQCYVQAFNQRYDRSGPLWQGRFKSCIVGTERYLMAVYRYIELNPVRAAMVERPAGYRWPSIHANLGLLDDPMVTPHARYLALGTTRAARGPATVPGGWPTTQTQLKLLPFPYSGRRRRKLITTVLIFAVLIFAVLLFALFGSP